MNRKSFSYHNRIRPRKKERGIAIIFTLGILGLLTVIALGFASTALLNNKLSQNISGDAYAKSMAKNLALSRAVALLAYAGNDFEFDYRQIYSKNTSTDPVDEKNAKFKDHLWKLNTKLDGVKIYSYDNGASPAYPVTWEYVKAQVRKADGSETEGIIGRYAYVVVADKGRLNPNINVGAEFNYTHADAYTRYGKHLAFPLDASAINNILDENANTSAKLLDTPNILEQSYRYTAFREVLKRTGIAEATYKEWFNNFGIGIHGPQKFRDDIFAFLKTDGTYKYFKKFSMKDTAWDDEANVTPATLVGIAETTKFSSLEGSADINAPTELTYIPFLKKMWDEAADKPQKNRVLQLAANIIQYNRSEDKGTIALELNDGATPSVTQVDPADWFNNTPAIMGIGRHPMINEVGIAVEVLPGLTPDPAAAPGTKPLYYKKTENTTVTPAVVTYEYEPLYKVRITPGVELIDPFGLGTGIKKSDIRLKGTVKITLQGSNSNGNFETVDAFKTSHFTAPITYTVNFDLDGTSGKDHAIESGNWQNGYSSYAKFFMPNAVEENQKGITIDKNTSNSNVTGKIHPFTIKVTDGTEPEKKDLLGGMKISKIEITNLKVLLKYGDKERDFAVLENYNKNVTVDQAKLENHLTNHMDKPQTVFMSCQVYDPFVNLNIAENVWEIKDPYFVWTTSADLKTGETFTEEALKELAKLYSGHGDASVTGGTLVDNTGAEAHQNTFSEEKFKTPADLSNDNTAGMDPAANGTTKLPFAYIRHAPMEHFWELASIHTGARWSTLDLTVKFNKSSWTFGNYLPDAADHSGTEYALPVPAGELFDQITFAPKEAKYTEGLINLNTDSHGALHALMNFIRTDYREKLTKNTDQNALPLAGDISPSSSTVLTAAIPLNAYNTAAAANPNDCIVCAIQACTRKFSFIRRSDLLIPAATQSEDELEQQIEGYAKNKGIKAALTDLQEMLTKGTTANPIPENNRVQSSQLIAKLMPYLRTAPVDMVYVIVLAQSIEDAGDNKSIMVDWDGTGYETAANEAKLKAKLGLTYKDNDDADKMIALPDGVSLPSKIMQVNTYGTYDLGADKITGEAKIVAAIVRDPDTEKWRITKLYYVE